MGSKSCGGKIAASGATLQAQSSGRSATDEDFCKRSASKWWPGREGNVNDPQIRCLLNHRSPTPLKPDAVASLNIAGSPQS
jgi:hypothetical protein